MKKLLIGFIVVTFALLIFNNKIEVEAKIFSNDNVEELRGVWISTVANMDIAKQNGTSEKAIQEYKNRWISIFNNVQRYNINAVFLQVRPCNDAFYESAYNPWSRYIVGNGINPGFDLLSFLVDEAHVRGIEIHAWLNPYRASVDSGNVTLSSDVKTINDFKLATGKALKEVAPNIDNPMTDFENENEFFDNIVLSAEKKLVLNPAKDVTINHIKKTINEIITNYEVDGIHFDDYFYPSGGIESTVEGRDYAKYKAGGGTLAMDDWRRDNVTRMVKEVSNLVKNYNATSNKRYVAFGISPCGVWAPSTESCSDSRGQEGGMNVACGSYSAYNNLYADTKLWVEEELLDYILPQVYYQTDDGYYQILTDWWSTIVSKTKVKLYIGTPLYRVEEWNDYKEINTQFEYVKKTSRPAANVSGFVLFTYGSFLKSGDYFKSALGLLYNDWRLGALTPIYQETEKEVNNANLLAIKYTDKYNLEIKETANANGYALYHFNDGEEINYLNKLPLKVFNQIDGFSTHNYSIVNITGTYVLYTIDNNNKFLETYSVMKNEDIYENKAPIVEIVDWPESSNFSLKDLITVKVKVTDDLTKDINKISASIAFSDDSIHFGADYPMELNSDGYFEYIWEPYMKIETKACFKISIGDNDKVTVINSPEFTVGVIEKTCTEDPTQEKCIEVEKTCTEDPTQEKCIELNKTCKEDPTQEKCLDKDANKDNPLPVILGIIGVVMVAVILGIIIKVQLKKRG